MSMANKIKQKTQQLAEANKQTIGQKRQQRQQQPDLKFNQRESQKSPSAQEEDINQPQHEFLYKQQYEQKIREQVQKQLEQKRKKQLEQRQRQFQQRQKRFKQNMKNEMTRQMKKIAQSKQAQLSKKLQQRLKDLQELAKNKNAMIDEKQEKQYAQLQSLYSQLFPNGPAISSKTSVVYKPGQFSKFAINQQTKTDQVTSFINKIIRQASYSHLKKVKQLNLQFEDFQLASKNKIRQMQGIVGSGNVLKALKDPISFFIEHSLAIRQTAGFMFRFMNIAKDTAVIQGKLIKKSQILFNQSFSHRNNIIVPTVKQNLYIKIGQGGIPFSTVLYNSQFRTRQQLSSFTPQMKNKILKMVELFLQSKGIVQNRKSIQQKAVKSIQQMQKQMQKQIQSNP